MGYLAGTAEMGLRLRVSEDGLTVLAFIDASFGIHPDGKGQSGSTSSLGSGSTYANSSKQVMTAKSSAESEAIATSDHVVRVLHTRNFIIAQGYDIGPAIVYQDNMSVMEVVKRGQNGSSQTKHIAIRYNFIRDYVGSGEIEIRYMPTEMMVADVLTKPMQGAAFVEARRRLLNWS
jgi:hypothetical protein